MKREERGKYNNKDDRIDIMIMVMDIMLVMIMKISSHH